ncbi:ACP S-malonyltransferase [Allostreptomyces psammosilenae]|uniref:[acyl-carrier-protein] S-malonyltransferase n=1 Tax=Allostreptomyces psammosilenae TaxID=1892865 RepID=A0A853A8E8_9ACTN|nr:ACP S-malonyltransferase [Allostreptomyces psammosilenae]NYI06712.1 [acyl-carrier-protein] S-malonyltransferase [Allostreptomyces psammosilenae]
MLVLVAPGQGAQTPGFLKPWLDLDGVADRLAWWSAAAGLDLVHYGTQASAEEIKDTAVAQPLLVAAGLAASAALFPNGVADPAGPRVGAVAGHSVGEITAAAIGGVLTPEAAMVLVRRRGLAMAEAAARTETGMKVLLGGDHDEVVAKIVEHGAAPANINGAGQIVAAGTVEELDALAEDPPAGVKVIPLAVAGAFHTKHMAPAVDELKRIVPGITPADPVVPYVSNTDGGTLHDGAEVLRRIVTQVSNPVRWDLCMETFRALGVTGVLEVLPAGPLTGLARRALPGVKTLAVKTPGDLDAAREFIAEHATAPAAVPAPAAPAAEVS